MVLYCSIMILLLAFFIVIQSFATQHQEDRFQSGQSSFKRALRTCGLGHLMDEYRRWMKGEASGPRYDVEEGDHVPPDTRRIDVEMENASVALRKLAQQLRAINMNDAEQKSVLVVPLLKAGAPVGKEGESIRLFSREILPILLEHECRIGIGGIFACEEETEPEASARALERARAVRTAVLDDLKGETRALAGKRLYSFCHRVRGDEKPHTTSGEVRVDAFVRKFQQRKEHSIHEVENRP